MVQNHKTHAFMKPVYDQGNISDQWDYLENCPGKID